jgi:hypothetical protein
MKYELRYFLAPLWSSLNIIVVYNFVSSRWLMETKRMYSSGVRAFLFTILRSSFVSARI